MRRSEVEQRPDSGVRAATTVWDDGLANRHWPGQLDASHNKKIKSARPRTTQVEAKCGSHGALVQDACGSSRVQSSPPKINGPASVPRRSSR